MSSTSAASPLRKHVPGPLDGPALRFLPRVLRSYAIVTPKFLSNPLGFLASVSREYGGIACVGIHPIKTFLIDHPDYIKHVLQDNHQNYTKGKMYAFLSELLGDGLLVSDGAAWKAHRRLAQPVFQRERHQASVRAMADATAARLRRWSEAAAEGRSLWLRDEMIDLTLDILLRTMFGAALGDDASAELRSAFVTADTEMDLAKSKNPLRLPRWVPTPTNVRFRRAVQSLDRYIYSMIDERRRSSQRGEDLLSMLLDARDEETGEGLPDRQLRDEVIALMHGGYEPLTDSLTWTWYLLAQHPEAYERLRAEVDTVLDGRTPQLEDFARLPYAAMVFQEAMRLYPAAWVFGRTAIGDDEIGGYHVPAKSLIVISPWVTQRNPAWWDDPERFDPERFTRERSERRHRFAYIPFAAGPRMCIARDLAIMEAQLILAMTLQEYEVELPDLKGVHPVTRYGLEPSRPIPMKLRKRAGSDARTAVQ